MAPQEKDSSPPHRNHRNSNIKIDHKETDTISLKDSFYGLYCAIDKCKDPERDKQEKKKELPPVGFSSLFRYSSCFDKILIAIGTLAAIIAGASTPGVNMIFGHIIDKFIQYDMSNKNITNHTMTTDEFFHSTAELCVLYIAVGIATVLCNYFMVSCFTLAAVNQAFKIKSLFMASILKQDIGWYDTTETGDFASRITGDLTRIQDGLGEKVCICISLISTLIIIVVTSMLNNWRLTLATLSYAPLTSLAMAIMSKIQASVSREEMQAYGAAGAVAEEVLSAIRTVVSYGGEEKEIQRYNKCLVPACKKGIKRGFITALDGSITWICSKLGFSLAFWYGIKLVVAGDLTGGNFVIVMFNANAASIYLSQLTPFFEAFSMARGSAANIYSIIERVPLIDSSSKEGKTPVSVKGTIRIRDAYFNYPARPTVPILKGVSLDIHQGERVALVGPSGCGKSTIIQLIQRFYDTTKGSVLLDSNNVKDLNVGWLRNHIGLVGQEPVLFSMTIAENIRYGKKDATQEEIENAAKTANIHNFIDALPLKYETLIGERGTQLSGGQKQRIAIARALVKNPKILLLDEATSALDTESESVVQAALDEASQGRTTVVVAHRLSTIRTADRIVVLSEGIVKEVGTHDELMEKGGMYFNLVQTQTKSSKKAAKKEKLDEREEYLISELSRKMSVLSGSSVGSVARLLGLQNQVGVRRSLSHPSWSHSSISSTAEDSFPGNFDDDLDEKVPLSQFRLWKLSASEWPYILVGGIAATLTGILFLVQPVLIGNILGVLSDDPNELTKKADVYCIALVVISIITGLFVFLQVFMFTVAGETITSRLRKMVFSNIISQDIEFFDHPKNSTGSLCARLTSDAASVQGATGFMISTLFRATTMLVAFLGMAFWFEYKIGLVVLALVPCIWLVSRFANRKEKDLETSDKLGTEEASKVAIEAIESIRTVASLHQEETILQKFQNHLQEPHKKSRKLSHVRGLVYGFTQGFFLGFADAFLLFYGSRLIANKELQYGDFLKVLESFFPCAMIIGQTVDFAPEYQKAKLAAKRIFQLLDIKPKIDAFSTTGKILEYVNGHIRFRKVYFTYSSRPNVQILSDLDLEVEPGKTVALVGSSGCGKSTCVQLMERFYDPHSGSVLLDDTYIGEMNVSNLRSHIGLVSQEPVLFSYSIAENIAYGDNSRQVDMEEIIEAAREANIHNFISTLPQGYETPVGDKGTQLSGGQKQRVAIARALLRNPKILLLDEATSALDAESEQIVQDALDKARSGRTCFIIAHRLTTVQNADVIMVMHKGRIVDKGTHEELLHRKGLYYKMHQTQSSGH
ncbi:hypothetical protein JTE90_026655 [Oedothorax gibbosus]|uniref:ABC-type xenobiotic transporter n=1 Tax=Oedothorax gibbosus TaxID=931172 RepID=A0AAV6TWR4_9ARAC|nr:hypothetical protein JTE90_026655 [Oedothorax gibbosus]